MLPISRIVCQVGVGAARCPGHCRTTNRKFSRLLSTTCTREKKFGSGRPLKKGVVSAKALVPAHISLPPYAVDGTIAPPTHSIFDLRGKELVKMRAACAFTRDTLEFAGSLVRHGVTTDEIDAKVFEHVTSNGFYPSRKCVCVRACVCVCVFDVNYTKEEPSLSRISRF
jgi:hypothetical protein